MICKFLFSTLAIFGLCTTGFAATEAKPAVGVVNFANCMTDSKLGQQEQKSFESLKAQMTSLMEDTEKQLNELAAKFNDSEYMDGLSPEAEDEMKTKYRTLNEEMGRYQNQFYQVMQQANMKIMQTLASNIQQASEKVAEEKKLTMVMNKEACFFSAPTLDVTNLVIAEMDKSFEKNTAKIANSKTPEAAVEQAKK